MAIDRSELAAEIGALQRVRGELAARLQDIAAWRALQHLERPERQGLASESHDSGARRRLLIEQLRSEQPLWRAYERIGDAIACLEQAAEPVAGGPRSAADHAGPEWTLAPARVADRHDPGATPNDGPGTAEAQRRRIKIRAGSNPVPETPAAAPAPALPSAAAPAPTALEPTLPAVVDPSDAEQRRARVELNRIRLISAIGVTEPGFAQTEERASPQPKESAPWRQPVDAPPLFHASSSALAAAPEPALRIHSKAVSRMADVAGLAKPGDMQLPTPEVPWIETLPLAAPVGAAAAVSPKPEAQPTSRPATIAEESRLQAVEAELELLIVGKPATAAKTSAARDKLRPVARPDDDTELDMSVPEAEVTIVKHRSDTPRIAEPWPPGISGPPVALSIRLKQTTQSPEFDGDSYDAYHHDVEEALVEIVRFDDAAPVADAAAPNADPIGPKVAGRSAMQPVRRLFKSISGR